MLGLAINSRLIGSNVSERSFKLRSKMNCYRSRDNFDCWIMDCSATRIQFSSIAGHNPEQVISSLEVGSYLSAMVHTVYSTVLADRAVAK